MKRRFCRAGVLGAAALAAVSLASCGRPTAPRSEPLSISADASARLSALIAKDQRVAPVAWRLAVSNADLCPATRPAAGWTLQSASQYGLELRSLAEQRYGLDGDLPGILSAPADSPAHDAGLRPGDLILTVNHQPLTIGTLTQRESYDGLQVNIDRLTNAATEGPLDLTVRRDGRERQVTVAARQACAYVTQVEVRDDLRALSDGRTIFISTHLIDIAQDDDQLAFLLAHELAHAVLEHARVSDVKGGRGALNAQISLRRGLSSRAESDADTLALFLLARAGFDPARAVQFLPAYEAAAPGSRYPQINLRGVYPSLPERRRALDPVLADIATRQARHEPLIP